ncbi:MAG: magnesium/cobalt efflux protein [Gammaproteobacteria bacterium 39-13]|nr:HlyC/CorC family transporter [Gammaproteobacteria bacterium]OJV95924.1 MAG: magnesium/cobalt efflux protein [Gammaproteobacteria bacterium 39-13]
MIDTHILSLSLALFFLTLLLTFFSLSETGILSINRYRLKHLAKTSKSAQRVQRLLERPDRLLGVILLGNTFVTITASSIATLLGVELIGERWGVIIADILITIVLLIFAEVFPKTLAALYPEKVAFPTSYILQYILKLLYPLVWITNTASNGLLKLCGISLSQIDSQGITHEELRTVVHETTGRIPSKHRKMLLSILDLEKVTVDDIMVPRHDVVGLDLDNDWDAILGHLTHTQHTFLPVYKQDLNNIKGVIHAKKVLHLMAREEFNEENLMESLDEAFFVPQGTPLTKQMINFQRNKQRFAMVVDEYGDIIGLITLEDILEEIVGDFTTDMATAFTSILEQEDGSYLVEGSTTIREFNRHGAWKLPTSGPKTINGLVIEQLQEIPEVGTCCLIGGNIPIEVVQVQDNRIKALKIFPPIENRKGHEDNDLI